MNDKYQPGTGTEENLNPESDPLDELTRIVSGEFEDEVSAKNTPAPTPKPEDILAANSPETSVNDVSDDLEAELMRELGGADVSAPSHKSSSITDHDTQPEDQTITPAEAEIEASPVQEEDGQDSIDMYAEDTSVTQSVSMSTVQESFDDALMSAIDEELSTPANVAEIDDSGLSFDDSAGFEDQFSDTDTHNQVGDHTVASEAEFVSDEPIVNVDTVAESGPSSSYDELADLEAELSSAFEEEQVSAEPDPLDVAEAELDFEAAFAQELNNNELAPPSGWQEEDAVAASAAFAAAARPGNADVHSTGEHRENPTGQQQPHVASQSRSAQQNGGSRKYAMVALIIALFAGVITAGYGVLGGNEESATGETPIIEASADPVKVKPEDPGGRVVANQNNASYEKVEGNELAAVEQEQLVSQTEEPAVIDTDNLPGNTTAKGEDRLGANQTQQGENGNATNAVTPRVVQVVTVKPDGTIVRTPVNKPEATSGTNTQIAAVDTEATPVPTEPIKLGEPIDGAQTTGEPRVPTASPLPKPEPEPKPVTITQPSTPTPKPIEQASVPQPQPAQPQSTPAPTAKSEWVVQVSAQTSAEAAQQSFDNMRNRYSVLQGRSMSVQRAVVNGTTYFRVRVQTASKDDASQLCNNLTAAGGNCFVTR